MIISLLQDQKSTRCGVSEIESVYREETYITCPAGLTLSRLVDTIYVAVAKVEYSL